MNGAQALLRSLADAGLDVLFANPGTSEMQLVTALEDVPAVRAVLCLFEGVATGAADGYARMTRCPAATLLHLGPGLANGLANLHNARRAGSAVLNLVGDHADSHLALDAPLTTDIDSLARPMSHWVGRSVSCTDLAGAAMRAYAQACSGNGRIATLIVPANHAWGPGAEPVGPMRPDPPGMPAAARIGEAAEALVPGAAAALFLGGRALDEPALKLAGRIAAHTGCRLLMETFPPRQRRGAGLCAPVRLPYFAEDAVEVLAGLERLVLVGAAVPVAFFAYPGKPGRLLPEGASSVLLADRDTDAYAALDGLAGALGVTRHQPVSAPVLKRPDAPHGTLTAAAVADSVAALLPADAIVVDEAATGGGALYRATATAPPHDWLTLTGGSIGQGLPLAVGAALACPQRRVLCMQGDGGAMYTLQALWTMARERLDVITVIYSNRRYAILDIELARVGAPEAHARARSLFDLTAPALDWVSLARGHGVAAQRAEDGEGFHAALAKALQTPGPYLIEAVLTPPARANMPAW